MTRSKDGIYKIIKAKDIDKTITINFCPKCNNYLAKTDYYKCCMYCGWKYDINKLKKEKI